MPIALRIEGLEEIKEALAKLPKATARNVQVRVLMKNAKPIVETAQRLAPVRVGYLKKGIHATTKRPRGFKTDAARAFAKAMAMGGDARGAAKAAGTSPVYVFIGHDRHPEGMWQELGTKHHRPQPHLRPAFDQHKDEFLENVGKDIWAEIERAAARLAKKRAKAGL